MQFAKSPEVVRAAKSRAGAATACFVWPERERKIDKRGSAYICPRRDATDRVCAARAPAYPCNGSLCFSLAACFVCFAAAASAARSRLPLVMFTHLVFVLGLLLFSFGSSPLPSTSASHPLTPIPTRATGYRFASWLRCSLFASRDPFRLRELLFFFFPLPLLPLLLVQYFYGQKFSAQFHG